MESERLRWTEQQESGEGGGGKTESRKLFGAQEHGEGHRREICLLLLGVIDSDVSRME